MDIVLRSAEGLPERAFISIRVGDTRRQAPWRGSEQRLSFPGGSNVRSVHVDVFEKVGSSQLSLAGIGASDGHQDVEVSVPCEDGGVMKVRLAFDIPTAKDTLKDAKPSRREAAKKAVDYMEQSGAQRLLSKLVQTMMVQQPEDPLAFIAAFAADETGNLKSGCCAHSPMASQPIPAPAAIAPAIVPTLAPVSTPDLTGHHSLLAKALNQDPSLYSSLRGRMTKLGVSFDQVIRPGVEVRGHPMIKTAGLVAGDLESFVAFAPLFDAVVALKCHPLALPDRQPLLRDPGKVDSSPIDPDAGHVLRVQMRLRRNLAGLRFPSACSWDERREAERVIAKALLEMTDALEGSYFPLTGSASYPTCPEGMDDAKAEELNDKRLLFHMPDSSIAVASGISRDWPDARGVFATDDSRLWAWLNEEDHLQLFAGDTGDSVASVFQRLCAAEASVREAVRQAGHDFACHDRLGFLTTGPAHLGTALGVTVFLDLPYLSEQPDFRNTCRELHLWAHQGENGQWAICDLQRMGFTEVEQVNLVVEGCRKLVQMERALH